MVRHRFKTGDLVRILASASANQGEAFLDALGHNQPTGVFEVTACLPEIDGEPQYRILGGNDHNQRVVRESQLISAVRPQPRHTCSLPSAQAIGSFVHDW